MMLFQRNRANGTTPAIGVVASPTRWTHRAGPTGAPQKLLRETTRAWVDNHGSPAWLADGTFLWFSERDGWKHLYRYRADGTLIGQVTRGAFEVRTLHGVDEAHGWIYFSGTERSHIGGDAYRLGDVLTASNGKTVEIDNTDAEGRLVLADCLLHARALGAERLVDLATLTGGVVTALGSVYAGAFFNDEDWAAAVTDAADRAGEPVWRLPLHERYAQAVKGRYADLTNSPAERKAHAISGAEFLHHFAGDVPWAHLDIAGVANDSGLPYMGHGGTGWGVRLLVDLADALAA